MRNRYGDQHRQHCERSCENDAGASGRPAHSPRCVPAIGPSDGIRSECQAEQRGAQPHRKLTIDSDASCVRHQHRRARKGDPRRAPVDALETLYDHQRHQDLRQEKAQRRDDAVDHAEVDECRAHREADQHQGQLPKTLTVSRAAHGEQRAERNRSEHDTELDRAVAQGLEQHQWRDGSREGDRPSGPRSEDVDRFRGVRSDRPAPPLDGGCCGSSALGFEGGAPPLSGLAIGDDRRLATVHLHRHHSTESKAPLQRLADARCLLAGIGGARLRVHRPLFGHVVQPLAHDELATTQGGQPVDCCQLVTLPPRSYAVDLIAPLGCAGHLIEAFVATQLLMCGAHERRGRRDEERSDWGNTGAPPPQVAQRAGARPPHLDLVVHPALGSGPNDAVDAGPCPTAANQGCVDPQLDVDLTCTAGVHLPFHLAARVRQSGGGHRRLSGPADSPPTVERARDEGHETDGKDHDHRGGTRQCRNHRRDHPRDAQRGGAAREAGRSAQRRGACTAATHSATTCAADERSCPTRTSRWASAHCAARPTSWGAT